MAAALPILIGASTAFQVVGAIKQAKAGENAANFNAQQAAQNAQLSLQQSAEEERMFRVQTRKVMGSNRAALGASGARIANTAEDILAQSAADMELDALKIRYGGELKARGLNQEADMYRQRANEYQAYAPLSAAGYLLGGASKFIDKGGL